LPWAQPVNPFHHLFPSAVQGPGESRDGSRNPPSPLAGTMLPARNGVNASL
jgi:hypothetical protein